MSQLSTFDIRIQDGSPVSELFLPGFSFGDFDRAGRIAVNLVAKIFEAGRVLSMKSNWLDFRKLLHEGTIVILGIHSEIDPNFLTALQIPCSCSLKIKTELVNLNKSSMVWKQNVLTQLDGKEEEVFRGKSVVVYVTSDSHVPQPFPSWLTKKFSSRVDTGELLTFDPIPEVPESAFHSAFVVQHSDMDHNMHLNNSIYIRYCLDTAAFAIKNGRLRSFSDDICWYSVKAFKARYRTESSAGERLTVYVWQEADDDATLHFVSTKNREKEQQSTFYCKMIFSLQQYPPVSKL